MSIELPEMDPNLVEVLEDVASDGSAFHAPRGTRAWREVLGAKSSLRSTGLTSAEKHLIQAHRSEAAQLLLLSAIRLTQAGPGGWRTLLLWAIPGEDQIKHRASALKGAESEEDKKTIDLIRRVVRPHVSPIAAHDALASSLRLVDSVSARFYLVRLYQDSGSLRSARHMAEQLVAVTPHCGLRRYCWQALGAVYKQLGKTRLAFWSFRKAYEAGQDFEAGAREQLIPLANMFAVATQADQQGLAVEVVSRIEELDLHESDLAFVRRLAAAFRRANSRREEVAKKAVRKRIETIGLATREILDAFQ